MFLALAVVLALLSVSLAEPGPYDHLYDDVGRADGAAAHPLTFFVKEQDEFVASCGSMLEAIATPGSAQFGQQLAFGELRQFADEARHAAVRAFAEAHFGAARVRSSANLDLVLVPDATVAEVERAFGVELHNFRHRETPAFVARRPRTGRAALPAAIGDAVWAVGGLTHLPNHRAGQVPFMQRDASRQRQAMGVVTPQLLWRYYGVHNRTVASQKAKNAIFAALGQSFSPDDLAAWQQKFMLPASKISQTIGPNQPQSCNFNPNGCIEASLDVQQITSTAQLGNTDFHAVDQSIQDIFLAWIQSVNQEQNPPFVNSISYGSLSNEDPKNDMEAFNTAACKAGLRGITIVVATGDDGVANFQARNNPGACGFDPSYPATSPFVTSVGATQGPEEGKPEIVCSSSTGGGITSGGGFSNIFSTPNWQKTTVKNYISDQQSKNQLPPANAFNKFGRAYPDIAAMGHNYQIEVGGELAEGSGTSASTPVFAAMVSLINGQRMAMGKKPIGFLTPLIYHMGQTDPKKYFHQVTSGENNCCAGQQGQAVCCQYGFHATDAHGGWSPTVGFGSPRFPAWEQFLVHETP